MTGCPPASTRVSLARTSATGDRPSTVCRPVAPLPTSEENRLAITAINFLEHMPDLEQRAIGTRAVEHGWYNVSILCGRRPERLESLLHQLTVAGCPQPLHPFPLGLLRFVSDFQDLDRRFGFFHEVVHPHDGSTSLFHLCLKTHRGVRDLTLEPP